MKDPKEQRIITKQVSRKLEELRPIQKQTLSIPSWINYLRAGLGMSLTQLAARTGVTQSSISHSIKLEEEGRITVGKLKEIANAMECDLVYAFVPRKKIEEIMHDQAIAKTLALMNETERHMELEDQKVKLNKNERLKELAEERLYSKYLWDK
jgi:predicted DNA-binding mobile mystery protein A